MNQLGVTVGPLKIPLAPVFKHSNAGNTQLNCEHGGHSGGLGANSRAASSWDDDVDTNVEFGNGDRACKIFRVPTESIDGGAGAGGGGGGAGARVATDNVATRLRPHASKFNDLISQGDASRVAVWEQSIGLVQWRPGGNHRRRSQSICDSPHTFAPYHAI